MKKRNLFITLGLALAMGVGVFAGVNARGEVKEAKAAGSGTYVYLNVGSWNSDGAWFLADFHTKNGDAWENVTMVKGSQVNDFDNAVYKFEIPLVQDVTFNCVTFLRQNPAYDTWVWDKDGGHTWGATAEYVGGGALADRTLFGRSDGQSSWYESWTPTVLNSSYYEQVVTLVGTTNRNMTFSAAGDPWQFQIEDVEIANSEEIIIQVARNGVVERYFGYDQLQSGAGSLLDAKYSARISKSASYLEIESTKYYKIAFGASYGGAYSFYAKSDNNLWSQVSSSVEADAWAKDFVENVGCLNTYDTNDRATWKPAKWDTYASDWASSLSNGAKYLFTSATASKSGSWVEKAAFIHDMCVSKYDLCNVFMAYNDGEEHTRGAKVMPSTITFNNSDNNGTFIIVTVSVITLAAVAGYFLLRRRKED